MDSEEIWERWFPHLAGSVLDLFISIPCTLGALSKSVSPADRRPRRASMVPDLRSSAREDDPSDGHIDTFQIFNASQHSACDRRRFVAAKIIGDHLPSRDIDLPPSTPSLTTSCAFCPPLKAIPLASFYKLHRLPPAVAMDEQPTIGINGVASVKLPHRPLLSTPESAERIPQNGVHNKLLEHVVRTPDRQPSPQPTHLSVPGASSHRVLQEEGPGYVAPKFEGKELQMDQGQYNISAAWAMATHCLTNSTSRSDGPDRRKRLYSS